MKAFADMSLGKGEVAFIKPNGKCGNCAFPLRRTDKDNDNFLFYPVEGVRELKKDKVYLLKCPKCKRYNVI